MTIKTIRQVKDVPPGRVQACGMPSGVTVMLPADTVQAVIDDHAKPYMTRKGIIAIWDSIVSQSTLLWMIAVVGWVGFIGLLIASKTGLLGHGPVRTTLYLASTACQSAAIVALWRVIRSQGDDFYTAPLTAKVAALDARLTNSSHIVLKFGTPFAFTRD